MPLTLLDKARLGWSVDLPASAGRPISARGDEDPERVRQQQIARLAHSYWESRGGQGGSAEEDWLRAERELRAERKDTMKLDPQLIARLDEDYQATDADDMMDQFRIPVGTEHQQQLDAQIQQLNAQIRHQQQQLDAQIQHQQQREQEKAERKQQQLDEQAERKQQQQAEQARAEVARRQEAEEIDKDRAYDKTLMAYARDNPEWKYSNGDFGARHGKLVFVDSGKKIDPGMFLTGEAYERWLQNYMSPNYTAPK